MPDTFPRSPHDTIGGLAYFPRMLDKIRLHAAGRLPEDYHPGLGHHADGRCVSFLRVNYDALRERVLAGGTDEELLEWCYAHGRRLTQEDVQTWSGFMKKRGWRDETAALLALRTKEAGLEHRASEIATFFDLIDLDEGREPPRCPPL